MKLESAVPFMPVRSLCVTAAMTALICIMTVVPRIPIPLGYAHLGDAVIFVVVLYMGQKEGAIAASVGSAFADLIGGFPIWIVPTLIIKYGMAVVLWRFVNRTASHKGIRSPYVWLGLILSAAWMVVGYTLGGAILYGGLAVGLTAAPGLIAEGILNVIAAVAMAVLLERVGFHIVKGE